MNASPMEVSSLSNHVEAGLYESERTWDPFRVLTKQEREAHEIAYLSFLRQRDGEIDLENGTLSHREKRMQEFDELAIRWQGAEINKDLFYKHLDQTPDMNIDPRILWLLVAAKSNRAEQYAVEKKIEDYDRTDYEGISEMEQYMLHEEAYHTRLLGDACKVFELKVEPVNPPFVLQQFIHAILYFPKVLSDILVFLGEVAGVHVFGTLYKNAHIFAEDPKSEAQLRSLAYEILVDEVGHVSYCRAQLSPFAMWCAKLLTPIIGMHALSEVKEIHYFIDDKKKFLKELRDPMPLFKEIDWMEK